MNVITVTLKDRTKTASRRETVALCAKYALTVSPALEVDEDKTETIDENEIKARLRKLGVVYEKTATPAELEALYENARELVAGSPLEENRPTDLGI